MLSSRGARAMDNIQGFSVAPHLLIGWVRLRLSMSPKSLSAISVLVLIRRF